ncbi:MAG: ribonuclease III, partial [Lachnospiraceae bacterium]|nr:ribonuclease III [Lachnospiraceae bacterium]
YPEKNEGELTKLRASLVCEHTLAICATEISLGECINLSKGEDRTGGRQRPSILSDAFESVIGAIYLDGGFEYAKQFIEKILLKDIEHKQLFYDAKTILQEIVQGEENESLTYELVAESGPDHCKEFTVVAKINDKIIGNGNGKTKKAAEQMAAYHAILELKNVSSK